MSTFILQSPEYRSGPDFLSCPFSFADGVHDKAEILCTSDEIILSLTSSQFQSRSLSILLYTLETDDSDFATSNAADPSLCQSPTAVGVSKAGQSTCQVLRDIVS